MSTPSERPTRPDLDDVPTLKVWELETISDLEKQIDRVRSGRGCKRCRGSGETAHTGGAGTNVRACGDCNGRGLV